MNIKQLFCRHEYEIEVGNMPVHYPNCMPIKYVQIHRCKKCNKTISFCEEEKYDYEKDFNEYIQEYEKANAIDTNNISDGAHTFGELYDHRAKLFSVICNQDFICEKAWKSKLHSDGSMYENYFIVGIDTPKGQATYHYKMKYWDLFHVKELERAPKWDGHTAKQAINRILSLS